MTANNTNAIGDQTSSDVASLLEAAQTCQELPKLTQNYSPSEKHLVEWCEGSGVSEAIARRAVRYLKDRKVIAHRIGWAVYSDEYSLGWFASGIDLATMKPQAFGQFKPDIAIQFPEKEKPTKYLSDKGHPYDAIALPHPDKDFWRRVVDDVSVIVDIDEGTKKSGAGLTCGLPSLALCGVAMWQSKGELVPNLAAVAVPGRTIRIRFDMDVITKKEVQLEVKKLVKALEKRGCNVLVAMWNPELGLKIDDVLVKHGPEMVHKIMSEAQPYPQWLKNLEGQFNNTTEARDTRKTESKNKRLLDLIENHWGQRLRFNEMTQQVELNGKADLDVERVYLRLADELGIDVPKATATDLVVVTAQKYAYSPVRDYLNSLTNITPIDLNSLAKRHLGTDNPLHATFLKKTLIAAVARAFEAGCKVDTICILFGDQGILKSTYWQTLASDPFFTDNLNDANEKDEKMKLRRYWMLEYGEFESVYKRKEIAHIKAFLSSRIDSLRVPYGRALQDFPRTSIFVGSTNKQEVLADETGHRRQWIIPVQQTIPIETVKAERDAIWAAAVAAYKAGEQWWLTPQEDALLAEANKNHQMSDTWEASILNYLEQKTETTIADLLLSVVGLNLAEQKRAEQMRVGEILCRNGWKKAPNPKRIDGKLQRYWEKVVTGSNGVVTEVVTPQNPLPDLVVDTVLLPVTTFLPTLNNNSQDLNDEASSEFPEKFEDKVVTPPPNNSLNPSVSAFQPVTTPPVTTSPPTPAIVGARHKELEEGDRVVIAEVGNLHEGQHGEIIHIGYGSRDTDYTVKLDKESRGNQRVRVTVPHGSKLTFLMKP